MKDKDFITIQGWMRSKLELKGTDLLTYALIYGFSKDGESRFKGSIKYIMDWTGSGRGTVIRSLKSLHERELTYKYSQKTNGVTFNEYWANMAVLSQFQNERGSSKMERGAFQNGTRGSSKMERGSSKKAPNIDRDNDLFDIDRDNDLTSPIDLLTRNAIEVLNYWNEVTKQGRAVFDQRGAEKNQKMVKRWLKKKYSVEEIKEVVKFKSDEWSGNSYMEDYLQPSTVFGDKFISYWEKLAELNAEPLKKQRFWDNVNKRKNIRKNGEGNTKTIAVDKYERYNSLQG